MDKIVVQYELELTKLRQQLGETDTRLQQVETTAKKSAKGAEKGFDDLKNKVKGGINEEIKNLGKTIIAAFAVQQLVSFGKEVVELAAKAEGIERAFSRLNNPNLLNELRAATKGTVSDVNLMQAAVKANNFKIPLEQLGGLFEFAAQRAADTGESVDYLTESIVLGISRKSIPILDNLGLSATEIQEEFKKTGDFAQAVGNIIDREMAKSGKAIDTTADKIARKNAQWENTKVLIGKQLIEAGNATLDFLRDLGDGIDNVVFGGKAQDQQKKLLENQQKELRKSQDQFAGLTLKDLEQHEAEKTRMLEKALKSRDKEQIAFYQNELKLIEAQKQKLLNVEKKSAKVTLEALQHNLQALKDTLNTQEVGSKVFKETQKEIAKLEEEIAIALGKETEAQKKNKVEREKATEANKKAREELEKLRQENDLLAVQDDVARKALQVRQDYANALKRINEEEYVSEEVKAQKRIELERNTQLKLQELAEEGAVKRIEIQEKAAEEAKQIPQAYLTESQKALDRERQLTEEKEKEIAGLKLHYQQQAEQAALDLGKQFLQNQYDIVDRQREYELESLEKKREAGVISEDEYAREVAQIKTKQAKAERDRALFEIAANTAIAILKVTAQTGVLAPTVIPGIIALGALQAGLVLAQPLPQYAKGTLYVDDPNAPNGIDTVHAKLTKGEAVIPVDKNKKYKDAIKAIYDGEFEKFYQPVDVLGALNSIEERRNAKTTAERMYAALKLQKNKGYDYDKIVKAVERNSRVALDDKTIKKLAGALKTGKNTGHFYKTGN